MKHDEDGANEKEARKVRKLYKQLFGKPMPRGWRIMWGVKGVTYEDAHEVFFNQHTLIEDLTTVTHELLHVAQPELEHGEAFSTIVRDLTTKALKLIGVKGL